MTADGIGVPIGDKSPLRRSSLVVLSRRFWNSLSSLRSAVPEALSSSLTRPPRRERERAAELSTPVEA
ncbi:hypothetical protein PGTUg99_026660 [Puccinia graminis f. sp. tritici]|uniref:Uncharacterized protein n=1 Tax=Puccinia graminis f. sp. tritici TaxID=56615 RepID=A0A5B0R8Y6_PUCGR|nr:hypothetical protein PGTUg99_026660 [Puccinia graminis f. sp. tritici]